MGQLTHDQPLRSVLPYEQNTTNEQKESSEDAGEPMQIDTTENKEANTENSLDTLLLNLKTNSVTRSIDF